MSVFVNVLVGACVWGDHKNYKKRTEVKGGLTESVSFSGSEGVRKISRIKEGAILPEKKTITVKTHRGQKKHETVKVSDLPRSTRSHVTKPRRPKGTETIRRMVK